MCIREMAQSKEDLVELPELILASGLNLDDTEAVDGASNDDGYVYCIAECEGGRETGYFKVGTASNTRKRLADLQTGNVRQLQFWGKPKWVSHRLTVERAAHSALSKYAINLGGGKEWFKAVTPNEKNDFYRRFCNATK